jgi:Skp family chaperone for outer membrane proteins
MRLTERLVTYTGLAVAIGLGLSAASSRFEASAYARGSAAISADTNPKIATCDVFKIAGKLMETELYTKQITDKRDELKNQLTPLENELKTLGDKLRAMGPNAQGPEAEQTAQEFQRKQTEYLKLGQGLDDQMNKFIAEQNFDAYKKVLDSINAVAERRGYTHVFSTRSTDDMKAPANPPAFLQGVLARPLAKSPTADDITDDVMADLKVQ